MGTKFTSSFLVIGGLIAFAITPAASAQQSDSGDIIVQISGAAENKGQILWRIFADKNDFEEPEIGGVTEGMCAPVNGTCTFTIPNIGFGQYAIMAGHDIDNNGDISKNPFSDERKGISNYREKIYWFPEFDKAKFEHNGPNTTVVVQLF